MKTSLIIGIAIALAAGAGRAAEKTADFRQTAWGMTMAEVKKAETRAAAVENPSPSELWYRDSLIGKYPAKILYQFADGKLVRGAYVLAGPLRPPDYDALKSLLTARHGNPTDVSPLNPFGERETTWRGERTEINLLEKRGGATSRRLSADKREDGAPATSLEINYYSVAWGIKDAAVYREETAEDRISDAVIRDVIESWHEVAPGVWEWNEM